MNCEEIQNRLNSIFNVYSYRQIVFWYDEGKEFQEYIEHIKLDNAKLHIIKEGNLIHTKYLIEHQDKESNYLIYAPFEQPNDDENYLADMNHYAFSFTADPIAMIGEELGIAPEFYNLIRKYSSFWKSKARRESFKNLNVPNDELDIKKAIIAVLCNQKALKFGYVVREVIVNNFGEENEIIKRFENFNVLDDFWDMVSSTFSYSDEKPSVNRLVRSLILNYTASLYQGPTPKSWDKYLVKDKNNAYFFISEFMNNSNYSEYYDRIAKKLEPKLNITSLGYASVDAYAKCDSFEKFDENIIYHYTEILYENQTDLGSEFKELLEDRKKTHFYPKYENNYNVLDYSNKFISLINEFMRIELPEDADDLIKIYAEKWVYLDSYYRKFYYFYDSLEDTEYLEDLRQLIENLYVNRFLSKINPIFTKSLEGKSLNDLDVLKQWKFYKQNIPAAIRKHKTAVIISDAFRYGCAVELVAELEKDPNRTPTIAPMLSSIPSYTALGMASLLPNKEIRYDNDNILVDDMNCRSTDERNKILNSYASDSLAISYEEVDKLKINDLKEIMKGVNLVYIYHNKIDARGDYAPSENEVFNAAQETIDDLQKLITKLSTLNYAHIYITADHGFIYNRDKLKEHDKVDLDKFKEKKHKRFIISETPLPIDGAVSISMDYLDMSLYANVPIGSDIFKAPGSSHNFVHGGANLEECIVPFLEVKAGKGARNQRTVELQLVMTRKIVTNHEVNLRFFQKENVSDTVVPLEASIYFVDEDNNKISGEEIIYADKNTQYSEEREFMSHFRLLQRQYDKSKDYYLIIRDLKEDIEVDRIPFTIDIAFQDGFDFL